MTVESYVVWEFNDFTIHFCYVADTVVAARAHHFDWNFIFLGCVEHIVDAFITKVLRCEIDLGCKWKENLVEEEPARIQSSKFTWNGVAQLPR